MYQVTINPLGGTLQIDIQYLGAFTASYVYTLWEANSNAQVSQQAGNNLNAQDDVYPLPNPVSANAGRIIEVFSTLKNSTDSDMIGIVQVKITQGGALLTTIFRTGKPARRQNGTQSIIHKPYIMKTTFIACLVIACMSCMPATAQDPAAIKNYYVKKADSSVLQTVKLDFAVPDIPAFKALGTDPSNILRPSSLKEIAMMFSNVRSGDKFIVPQNLAVELTPGLLVKPWYTLQDYRRSAGIRWLSKRSVSVGSDQDPETNINSLAFGFRSVVFDRGDYRLDSVFLDSAVYRLQDKYTLAWNNNIVQYRKENDMTLLQYIALPQTTRDSIIEVARQMTITQIGFDLDNAINQSMQEFKKKNWNAPRMDLAYALVMQSPDSLLGSIKLNKHLVWWAWAFRPGKNNRSAQFVFGLNNSLYKANGKFYNEFTGNFRFYIGKNRLKALAEAQYQNIDHPLMGRTETLYSQVGVELAVYKSIWLHFGTGFLNALNGTARSQLLSNLNLYFSFPENFKLF